MSAGPRQAAQDTRAARRVRVWLVWYGEQQEPIARVVGVAGGGGWEDPKTRYTLSDWSGEGGMNGRPEERTCWGGGGLSVAGKGAWFDAARQEWRLGEGWRAWRVL